MLDVLKKGLSVLAVLSVVSCGGGGGDSYITGVDTVTGGGTSTCIPEPQNTIGAAGTSVANTCTTIGTNGSADASSDDRIADLEIGASSRQLGSNGTEPVTISAVVKDQNNNTLKDVDVQFAVDNNGTIEPDANSLDSSVKTASLTPGLNRPENRTLTVTVAAGDHVRTMQVEVTGTVVQLDGPERIVSNTPTQFVVKLKDSSGAGLPYQLVNLQSASNNVIGVTSDLGFHTDNAGELAFTVTASGSGNDTITVSALGAAYAHDVSVSGDEFVLSSNNKEITVGTDEQVYLLWERDGVAQTYKQINVTATRGSVPASVTTDGQGKVAFALSSSTAGGTVVTAVDVASGLTASMVREFVAVTPKYLIVQPEKSTIGPEEQATVSVLVRDVYDNPVKNQQVNFNVYDSVAGKLSNNSAITDSLGRASVVYTAGNATSAKDGVAIYASLQNYPEISGQLTLTVGKRALRIVLGDDEKLSETGVFYQKSYGVIVTDGAGNPVAGKLIDFTLIPTHYHKGGMVCVADAESTESDAPIAKSLQPNYSISFCPSEDSDNDRELGDNEDYNNSGTLDPTRAASIAANATTDDEGKATVKVTYPQSEALWSSVRLEAKISDEGSEYYETVEFTLPVLASDVSDCDMLPPNAVSPYGTAASCGSYY